MNWDPEQIDVDDLFAAAKKNRDLEDTVGAETPIPKPATGQEDIFSSKQTRLFRTSPRDLMSPPRDPWNLESPVSAEKPSLTYRLHEFWRGNNEFCLNGRFLSGLRRTSGKKTLSLGLVLLLLGCYLTLPLPFLFTRVSKILALMPVYMLLITIFFYVLTVT